MNDSEFTQPSKLYKILYSNKIKHRGLGFSLTSFDFNFERPFLFFSVGEQKIRKTLPDLSYVSSFFIFYFTF